MSSYQSVQEKPNDAPQPKKVIDNCSMSETAQKDWDHQMERSRELAKAREGNYITLV